MFFLSTSTRLDPMILSLPSPACVMILTSGSEVDGEKNVVMKEWVKSYGIYGWCLMMCLLLEANTNTQSFIEVCVGDDIDSSNNTCLRKSNPHVGANTLVNHWCNCNTKTGGYVFERHAKGKHQTCRICIIIMHCTLFMFGRYLGSKQPQQAPRAIPQHPH